MFTNIGVDILDKWSVYPLGKVSQNGTALQEYSRKVGVPPVLKTENSKSELGVNGNITVNDTVLNKPPQNPIIHGKILQSQIGQIGSMVRNFTREFDVPFK